MTIVSTQLRTVALDTCGLPKTALRVLYWEAPQETCWERHPGKRT
jgi:hypothetical protein